MVSAVLQAIFILGIISYGDAELTILKQDETFHCISSGDFESSAIAWTKPFLSLSQTTPPSWLINEPDGTHNKRLSQVLNCDLSDDKLCPGWYDPDTLQMVSNLEVETRVELGPVLDYRWERFPLHQTREEEFLHKITISNDSHTSMIHLSVLVKDQVYFALTGEENIHESPAYWISIQDNKQKLWKCPNGMPAKGKGLGTCVENVVVSSIVPVLNESNWVHLTFLLLNGPDYMNIILRSRNQTLIDWKDAAPYSIKYVSYRTHNTRGYWRAHSYNVLQPKTGHQELLSPKVKVPESQPLCVSLIYHSTAGQGQLRVLKDGKVHDQVDLKAGKGWQVSRLQTTLMGNTNYKVSIVPPNDFLIGDIRVCDENEVHFSTVQSKKQGDISECELLKSGETVQTSAVTKESAPIFSCLDNKFGAQCNLTCGLVLKNQQNCHGVTACNRNSCSCLAGYTAPNCTTVCKGKFGPGCQRNCSGNCKAGRTCNPHNGVCPLGCKDGWQSARCDNWFPKVLQAPKLENAFSNSLEITIYPAQESHDNFEFNTFEIELQYKERHQTSWHTWEKIPRLQEPSIVKTLGGLEDDTTYLVRVVLLNNEGEGYTGEDVPTLTASTFLQDNFTTPTARVANQMTSTGDTSRHTTLNIVVIVLSILLAICGAVILMYVVRYNCKSRQDAQTREMQEKLNSSMYNDMQRFSKDASGRCCADEEENMYEQVRNTGPNYENFVGPAIPTRA